MRKVSRAAIGPPREFVPGDSTARQGREDAREPAEVGLLAQVVGEHALVQVAERVVGDADVGARQAPLEAVPRATKKDARAVSDFRST